MRLLQCRVENFGRLSGMTYTFTKGMNQFLDGNGSGKTTLACFIKAMFYGLSASRSRSVEDNERKKFAPWQGGLYGGSLTFVHGEKTYKIERSFGKTPKDDFFKLTDLKSGKPCEDYSEDIGQELFGINSHAFIKSVYFSKDIPGEKKEKDGIESITAKLNGITDPSDVASYNSAQKKLTERRKQYENSERALKGKLDETQKELILRKSHEQELDDASATLEKLRLSEKELEKEEERLESEYKNALTYETRLTKHNSYIRIKDDIDQKKEELRSISDFFGGDIPNDTGKIAELEKKYSLFSSLTQKIQAADSQSCRYAARFEKEFPNALPEAARLKELQRVYNGARLEIENLEKTNTTKSTYADSPSNVPLLSANEHARISRLLYERDEAQKEADLAKGALGTAQSKRLPLVFIILSVFFGVISVTTGLCAFWGRELAAPLVIIAVIALVLFVISVASCIIVARGISKEQARLKDRYAKLSSLAAERNARLRDYEQTFMCALGNEAALTSLWEKAQNARERMARDVEYKAKRAEADMALKHASDGILSYFKTLGREDLAPQDIDRLISDLETYERIHDEAESITKQANSAKAEFELYKSEISLYLSFFEFGEELDIRERFQNLRDYISRGKSLKNAIEADKEALSSLISSDPECALSPLRDTESAPPSGPDVALLIEKNKEELSSLRSQINYNNVLITKLSELCEGEGELEEELKRTKEEYERVKYRLKVINMTSTLLEQARQDLSGRYLESLREGFKYYMELIGKSSPDIKPSYTESSLDSDLKPTLSGEGIMREAEYFSSGTRDLMELAMHLALSKSLFEGMRTFIIMDDPFVNLDKEKIERALDFLSDLALNEDVQVIYFTCHESRLPQKSDYMSL